MMHEEDVDSGNIRYAADVEKAGKAATDGKIA